MVHLINKDALIAKIDDRINELKGTIAELGNQESHECGAFHDISLYQDVRSLIDSLEVKEINLDKDCRDLDDDGICRYASTKLGRDMLCEKIKCSRKPSQIYFETRS